MVLTDDDLAAIERLLMYGVIGTDPADASGATTDDVAEVAGDLLAEVKRLQEERSAMLDPARERTNFLEAEVARLRAVIARKSRTSLVTTVTDLEVESDAACLSCEGPVVHPFLRVMATDMTEAVPAGTVGDECSICAQKYGRWARRQP